MMHEVSVPSQAMTGAVMLPSSAYGNASPLALCLEADACACDSVMPGTGTACSG